MKKLFSLTFLLGPCLASLAGAGLVTGTLSPVGNGGGLSSNQVYQMIQQFAPTNGGITAAQAATQINDTNVNRIQPVVDAKLTITNSFVPTNGGKAYSLTITNGKDIQLDSEEAAVSRIISSGTSLSPFDEGFIKFANGLDPFFRLNSGANNHFDIFSEGDFHADCQSYWFTNGSIHADGSGITNILHGNTVSAGANTTVTLSKNTDGSTNFQVAATGGSGGSLFPPDTVGVLTNNGSGFTNWSTSIPIAWVGDYPQAAATLSNNILGTLPPRTNYYVVTNALDGRAVVIVGPDANGNFYLKGTNWPTGGAGSQTPWTSPIDGASFGLTNFGNLFTTNVTGQVAINTNASATFSNRTTTTFLEWSTNQSLRLGSNGVPTITLKGIDGSVTSSNLTATGSGSSSNWLGGISYVASNAAPYTVVTPAGLNTLNINQGWTNNFNRQADMFLMVAYNSVIGGVASLSFTNSVTIENWTNSITLGSSGTLTELIVVPDISPGDYGKLLDNSGANAGTTIPKAWWKLK